MKQKKAKRVAIALEMEWGFKRHLETYAGCQRYADKAGWECSITPSTASFLETENGAPPFDGILARTTTSLATTADRMNIPVVNLWMNSPVKGLPSVFPEFDVSGKIAAEHLLNRGFKRFGYLGFSRDKDAVSQLSGFRNRLNKEGLDCSAFRFLRRGATTTTKGWKNLILGMEKWLATLRPPVGIFVVNDLYCRYLIDVCRAKGLSIPEDLGIIGSSNEETICASPSPTLTSIDLNFEKVGYRAAKLLDQLMLGEKCPSNPILIPPNTIVPRQSTDSYAADHPVVSRALRFISENAHKPIKVNDVANKTGINRRSLERQFHQSLNKSVAGEITRLRIARVKRHLIESTSPLKTVARECGFRNADHLYKVFTRIEKITPSQYRNQLSNQGIA